MTVLKEITLLAEESYHRWCPRCTSWYKKLFPRRASRPVLQVSLPESGCWNWILLSTLQESWNGKSE